MTAGEEEIDIAKTPRRLLKAGTYVVRPKVAAATTLWPVAFVVEPEKPMTIPFRLVGLIRTYAGTS